MDKVQHLLQTAFGQLQAQREPPGPNEFSRLSSAS